MKDRFLLFSLGAGDTRATMDSDYLMRNLSKDKGINAEILLRNYKDLGEKNTYKKGITYGKNNEEKDNSIDFFDNNIGIFISLFID